jgi:hypothetical protein
MKQRQKGILAALVAAQAGPTLPPGRKPYVVPAPSGKGRDDNAGWRELFLHLAVGVGGGCRLQMCSA